jgi:hypothetical protein
VSNPVPSIVRVWRWGMALIIAVGLLGACPLLTGTYIPFFLVCLQALVILALMALSIGAKIPTPLKVLLLLTLASRLAGRRKQAIHQVPPIPVVPEGDEQRYAQYEQPSVNYPEMLPSQ